MCESLRFLYMKLKGATKVKARAKPARSGRMERRSRSISRTPEASRFQSVNAGAL